jgi:hypothetical protein
MPGFVAAMQGDLDHGLGVVVLMNGPGAPNRLARHALRLLGAARQGQEPAPLPPVDDPTRIPNAADYAGTYTSGERTLTLVADGEHLVLLQDGVRLTLDASYDEDTFQVPHPGWDRYLLRFGRADGRVVEAFHGPTWFAGAGYAGPRQFHTPAAWAAYPGHYRSHNPWLPSFRVVVRKGALLLILPAAIDGFEEEQPLIPLGGGRFRVGAAASGPEHLRFDRLANGQALRATLSGADYYRFFTP